MNKGLLGSLDLEEVLDFGLGTLGFRAFGLRVQRGFRVKGLGSMDSGPLGFDV